MSKQYEVRGQIIRVYSVLIEAVDENDAIIQFYKLSTVDIERMGLFIDVTVDHAEIHDFQDTERKHKYYLMGIGLRYDGNGVTHPRQIPMDIEEYIWDTFGECEIRWECHFGWEHLPSVCVFEVNEDDNTESRLRQLVDNLHSTIREHDVPGKFETGEYWGYYYDGNGDWDSYFHPEEESYEL